MRILLAAVTVALLISGCGSVGTGSNLTPSPSPSTNSRLTFAVTVTEMTKDATLRVGQKLEVVLHAGSGMTNWTQPRSGDLAVLAPTVDPAATAVRGVTLAAFQARAPGHADITAFGSPICPSGQVCPMYVVAFSVRVTVTP